jgi:quercetin dioxygenase-like cupin family protein
MPVIDRHTLEGRDFHGAEYGASVSLILNDTEPGHGPRLHRHPYDETWVVQEGTVMFQLGEEHVTADAGAIVVAPPGVPHKFTVDGPGRAKLVCIHASPTMVTEWLE